MAARYRLSKDALVKSGGEPLEAAQFLFGALVGKDLESLGMKIMYKTRVTETKSGQEGKQTQAYTAEWEHPQCGPVYFPIWHQSQYWACYWGGLVKSYEPADKAMIFISLGEEARGGLDWELTYSCPEVNESQSSLCAIVHSCG